MNDTVLQREIHNEPKGYFHKIFKSIYNICKKYPIQKHYDALDKELEKHSGKEKININFKVAYSDGEKIKVMFNGHYFEITLITKSYKITYAKIDSYSMKSNNIYDVGINDFDTLNILISSNDFFRYYSSERKNSSELKNKVNDVLEILSNIFNLNNEERTFLSVN